MRFMLHIIFIENNTSSTKLKGSRCDLDSSAPVLRRTSMNKQIALIAVASIVIMLTGSVIMMDETSAAKDSNPADTDSLKAAIQNTNDNDTITLGGSFELTDQIDVKKPLNIDLGGHQIEITTSDAAGFFFEATSTISNGKIVDNRTNSPDTNGWRVLIASGPTVTLTVSDLKIEQANPDNTGNNAPYNYAIRGNDGASITLEAGTTITSPKTATEGSQGVVGVAMVGDNDDSTHLHTHHTARSYNQHVWVRNYR